ncbi:MAG: metallophosphoesterase [Anaerolineae bacterium]|nr:metallophosphoesterase [Anaerolineae bacterium]
MPHRFAVITDTHFYVPGTVKEDATYWNRVLYTRGPDIADSLVATVNDLNPDFVIHCGDFTGHCAREHFDYGCQVMNRLSCPWYAVLGNHDTWNLGIRDPFSALYGLPMGQCSYSRDLAGLRFIFLDVTYWIAKDGQVSPYLDWELYRRGDLAGMGPADETLRWLETELARSAGYPTILVTHSPLGFKETYPIVTLPKGQPAQASRTSLADFMGDVLRRREMRAIICRHPQVKIAFAGHWHICDATEEDGVVFCQTPALREYPFEIRLVEVHDGSLAVTTVGLNDGLFRRLSYAPEWGNDWVAGMDRDREFSVRL